MKNLADTIRHRVANHRKGRANTGQRPGKGRVFTGEECFLLIPLIQVTQPYEVRK